ncbi:MAG: hypothetical protein ABII18_03510 [bacterium]|nr:hypothetical protein [bacterium]MBU1918188.1 hypothetical protein [bacterium]
MLRRITKYIITTLILTTSIFLIGSCSHGSLDETMQDGDTIVVASTACVYDADCDGDGLYSSCDADDEDSTNVSIKEGCDEDEDGFVDTACSSSADQDGDGFVTADERDINCDVCPGFYDPEQIDSNDDGVGDECADLLNVNESVLPPDEEDDLTADVTDGLVELVVTDHSDRVYRGGKINLDLTINNGSTLNAFIADVVFMKGSVFQSKAAVAVSETAIAFCEGFYTSCTYLDEQEIEIADGYSVDLGLSFKIPQTLATGTYDIKIRLMFVDDDGNREYVDRVLGLHQVVVTKIGL